MEAAILNNGNQIPVIGLGVYQVKNGVEKENSVKWALEEIAKKYNKSAAQILIRWELQYNIDVFGFQISIEDMDRLDSLNEGFRVSWNPEGILDLEQKIRSWQS